MTDTLHDPDLARIGVTDIAVLRLQPGDTIVARIPRHVVPEALAGMQNLLRQKFPGHDVLIVADGVTIEIVRPEPRR